jgi:hypothetical protein
MERSEVVDIVKAVIRGDEGDYELPQGRTPESLMEEHAVLMQNDELATRERGYLLDVVVGPKEPTWDNEEHRNEDKGMIPIVKDYGNGGLRAKLRPRDLVAIYAATITAVAAIVVGIASSG